MYLSISRRELNHDWLLLGCLLGKVVEEKGRANKHSKRELFDLFT